MTRGFDGLWQEWEALLDPAEVRTGSRLLAVRAVRGGRPVAYDAVPVSVSEDRSPPPMPVAPGRNRCSNCSTLRNKYARMALPFISVFP